MNNTNSSSNSTPSSNHQQPRQPNCCFTQSCVLTDLAKNLQQDDQTLFYDLLWNEQLHQLPPIRSVHDLSDFVRIRKNLRRVQTLDDRCWERFWGDFFWPANLSRDGISRLVGDDNHPSPTGLSVDTMTYQSLHEVRSSEEEAAAATAVSLSTTDTPSSSSSSSPASSSTLSS